MADAASAITLAWSDRVPGTAADWQIQTGSPGNVNVGPVLSTGVFPRGLDFDQQTGLLYWTLRNENKVQRAQLDGTGVTTLVEGFNTFGNPISGSPRGIHVYPALNTMFWTTQLSDEIQRADLDGQNRVIAVSNVLSDEVIADEDNQLLYFSNTTGAQGQQGAYSIERSTFTGTARTPLVTGLIQVTDLEVDLDAGKLYWIDVGVNGIDDTAFRRANLDGTGVETILGNLADAAIQFQIDPDNDRFYWTSRDEGAIKSARLSDGSDIQFEITGLTQPHALTIIPEPTAGAMLVLGLFSLCRRRRMG